MREIKAAQITETVKDMCIRANWQLPADVRQCLRECQAAEDWEPGADILKMILQNVEIAEQEHLPLCQDTGMACVFVEIGQELHVVAGDLNEAIQSGVKAGYEEGFLRKSIVADPISRVNTKTNLPAFIYTDIVPGEQMKITVAPKGAGSENMSRIKMCKPSDGVSGMKDFVLKTVKMAGPNPCPPIVVGVGIGGTFDKVALAAKKALLRPLTEHHADPFYRNLEAELLHEINATGIGPQGFGGKTTALNVSIEALPTHIACLPAAVNINCHVSRHITEIF